MPFLICTDNPWPGCSWTSVQLLPLGHPDTYCVCSSESPTYGFISMHAHTVHGSLKPTQTLLGNTQNRPNRCICKTLNQDTETCTSAQMLTQCKMTLQSLTGTQVHSIGTLSYSRDTGPWEAASCHSSPLAVPSGPQVACNWAQGPWILLFSNSALNACMVILVLFLCAAAVTKPRHHVVPTKHCELCRAGLTVPIGRN